MNTKIESDRSIRTKEIDELLGRAPNHLIYWGMTWMALVILVLFIGSLYFKYPIIVQGHASLKENNSSSYTYIDASFEESSCGKLAVGQIAVIELNIYPSQEYGLLRGKIFSISPYLKDQKCFVTIRLDEPKISGNAKINTNYDNLSGIISVVVQEETIFKYLSKNNHLTVK